MEERKKILSQFEQLDYEDSDIEEKVCDLVKNALDDIETLINRAESCLSDFNIDNLEKISEAHSILAELSKKLY